jgi:Ca2+-binding RTX toxin-like protein
MTTFNVQNTDIFNDADPGIAFDTDDESWTISSDVLVSSGANDGVFSSKANSTLVNNGTILSASEFGGGVEFDGDVGSISNAAGAKIIGATNGIFVDGHAETIANHGAVSGLSGDGVVFGFSSDQAALTNDGAIFGRQDGIGVFSSDGAVIHNLGRIAADDAGIDIDTPSGHTTTITNAAGATISGANDAILVEEGGLFLDNRGTVDGHISMTLSADPATIVNQGTIQGFVLLSPGDDVFIGTGGSAAAVIGGAGNDHLVGSSHADFLFGDVGNDRINGAAGNDTIGGGPGLDTLTGGPGRDHFVFETELDPVHNVDRITDFSPHVDKIVLNDQIFQQLGHDGLLAAAHFHIGAAAADASDRIIYNPVTGFLFYDPDGRGGTGEIHFATLAPHLSLHNTDFIVTHQFVELI